MQHVFKELKTTDIFNKGKQLLCETSHDIQKGAFYLFSFVRNHIFVSSYHREKG